MIARIVLDVVSGPARPIALILLGTFVVIVLIEGAILAAFGLRPIGKAFSNSFLLNMAACGAGFIFWMACEIMGLNMSLATLSAFALATVVQGLVLMPLRENLSTGRAWLAAAVMKLASAVLLVATFLLFIQD